AELTTVAQRCATDGLCAMGLRFSEDKTAPGERFATLKQRLGDAFEIIEIDSGPGNAGGFGAMAHSVLTDEVREVDGQLAYEARKRVVEFLARQLK
ncbi:MAG: dienelactone hydrolase, partial [Mycobacterium sp.]